MAIVTTVHRMGICPRKRADPGTIRVRYPPHREWGRTPDLNRVSTEALFPASFFVNFAV